jgi:hypothetical protein
MMAIDAAGPRSSGGDLLGDVRDIVRHCLGALLVFEVNPAAPEPRILEVFEEQAEACQRMVRAALNAR